MLPVGEPELRQHLGPRHRGVVRPRERPADRGAGALDLQVRVARQEPRAETVQSGRSPNIILAVGQARRQPLLRLLGEFRRQAVVVGAIASPSSCGHVPRIRLSAPPARPGTGSSCFGAARRGSFASRITMSAMCVTTHWKYSGVSLLMSMSGAGFMKSMA